MIDVLFSYAYQIIGAFLLACFAGYIAWRNNRINRRAIAAETFRAAFTDAKLSLDRLDVLASTVVHEFYDRHIAAIHTFRHFVPWHRRRRFDASCREYQKQVDGYLNAGLISQFASEQTPDAKVQREALTKSIRRLVADANET